MSTALRGGRFVVQAVVFIGLVGGLIAPPAEAVAVAAQTAEGQRVLALVNATRASVGAPPLAVDAGLSAVAQSWAGTIAAGGSIRHNPSLRSQVTGWTAIAENVGMGGSIDIVHRVLVASPSHYGNMTDRRFNRAGAGTATSGGKVFVVQVFVQGQGSVALPPPPPPPPPPPAPKPPAPKPAPAPADPVPDPAPVVAPVPEPGPPPAPEPAPAPAVVVEASDWLANVFEQLWAIERALG